MSQPCECSVRVNAFPDDDSSRCRWLNFFSTQTSADWRQKRYFVSIFQLGLWRCIFLVNCNGQGWQQPTNAWKLPGTLTCDFADCRTVGDFEKLLLSPSRIF